MKITRLPIICVALSVAAFVCCSCSGGDANTPAPKDAPKSALLDKSTNKVKNSGGNMAPDSAMTAPPGVKTGTP